MRSSPAGQHDPLVSVGLPVYNGAERLSAAVDSALRQSYANLEVIISDNASEDETEAIGRRLAASDVRVRYMRNATNIGFLPNFEHVLDQSRGAYFTWLAHDDVLSDPSYVTTVVDYLETHPQAVACATALYLLDNELPGSVELLEFPELAPERWPHARQALFRWPHGWLDSFIYGIFRREELTKIRIPHRTYKGQPHIFCWEMDVLTALSGRGPIVALPEPMRSFRLSTGSVGMQISGSVSSYDLFLLGLKMKAVLFARGLRLPIPWRERLSVTSATLGNAFRANFRQPYDLRVVLQEREKELALLRATTDDRAHLIDFLRAEISARRDIALAQGLEAAAPGDITPVGPEERPEVPAHLSGSLSRGAVRDFFSPLTDAQMQRLHELNEHIGRLRPFCAAQLRTIAQLQTHADEWLKLIESIAPSGSLETPGS